MFIHHSVLCQHILSNATKLGMAIYRLPANNQQHFATCKSEMQFWGATFQYCWPLKSRAQIHLLANSLKNIPQFIHILVEWDQTLCLKHQLFFPIEMIKAFAKMLQINLSNHKKKSISFVEKQFLLYVQTIGLILIYYIFSIGITFYQKWFIKVSAIQTVSYNILYLCYCLIATALPLSIDCGRVPHVCQILVGSPLSSSLSTIYRYAPNVYYTLYSVTFIFWSNATFSKYHVVQKLLRWNFISIITIGRVIWLICMIKYANWQCTFMHWNVHCTMMSICMSAFRVSR